MRTYKFRAWNVKGKEMYYPDKNYKFVIDNNSVGFYPSYDKEVHNDYNTILSEYEDEIIVMQFTGLKDREGVEIFEGDILDITKSDRVFGSYSSIHKVEYVEQSGKFHLIGTLYDNMAEGINNISGKNCSKVIGNIYENPKLLK